MTLESAEKIKQHFTQIAKGEKLVKMGISHTIVDIQIEQISKEGYAVLVLGEDERSGNRFSVKSLYAWLADTKPDLLVDYEAMRQ